MEKHQEVQTKKIMKETIGGANKRNMREKLSVNRNGQSNLHQNHLHFRTITLKS